MEENSISRIEITFQRRQLVKTINITAISLFLLGALRFQILSAAFKAKTKPINHIAK